MSKHHQPVFLCSGCSHYIFEGESVWHIMGEQYCCRCIRKARKEAFLDEAD